MAKDPTPRHKDLPADNGARLALFDAIAHAEHDDAGGDGLSEDALFDRVIGRLRVLVPRELHIHGEREYVRAKVDACLEQGILCHDPLSPGRLRRGPETPQLRYPDGTIRDYAIGLEAARERLEADETKLRRANFDVCGLVPTSDRLESLVASMHEHGFLDQSPVTMSASGQVIDGRARSAAAADAGVPVKSHVLAVQRDTPLHHVLLVLDANADRLSDEDRARVRAAVEARTRRSWRDIQKDLMLTREWRRSVPKRYAATLDVNLVAFAEQHEPKVQITTDGTRIGLTSVMRQAGVADYNRNHIAPYVAIEEARTKYSGGGQKPWFVNIADAIVGIEKMQSERAERGLKVDSAWDDIRSWLIETFASKSQPDTDQNSAGPPSTLDDSPLLPGFA